MSYGTASPIRRIDQDRKFGEYVCWSRMQAEAGQGLETIVARKERERRAGGGLFLWGVGNAPAVAINALARMGLQIPVVFSIMKTRAKPVDVSPTRIVIWRRYIDVEGIERPLPEHTLITSRGDSARGAKKVHYALMCWSDAPLQLQHGTRFDHHAYRNVSRAGAPVAASQVTALLKPVGEPSGQSDYEVNLQAWLSESYWVRLTDPIELSAEKLGALAHCTDVPTAEWVDFVSGLRVSDDKVAKRHDLELRLF